MPQESIFYAGDNVTLGCSIDYHGNQAPAMDWHLPNFHVDEKNVTYIKDITEYKVGPGLLHDLKYCDLDLCMGLHSKSACCHQTGWYQILIHGCGGLVVRASAS